MEQAELLGRWARDHRVSGVELSRVEAAIDAGNLLLPGLDVAPFYDPSTFEWATAGARAASALEAEMLGLESALAPHPEADVLISRGSWSAFFLWRGGRERAASAALAPVAKAVTALAPGGGEAGNAYYSILGPGTEIRAHTGRFNARLRCHVGLVIPDAGWIEVAGQRRVWRAGECLIFSDALPHRVVMDASEARAVFAFDFWHPDVTSAERAALSMLLTSNGSRSE